MAVCIQNCHNKLTFSISTNGDMDACCWGGILIVLTAANAMAVCNFAKLGLSDKCCVIKWIFVY